MVGILSGDVTNTPGLGAAQQANSCLLYTSDVYKRQGLVGLPDIGMVDVVFYEEYVFHLAIQQRLVVGESQDCLLYTSCSR